MKEKTTTIWIIQVLVKVLLLSHLAIGYRGADENGVCGDLDIRNDVEQLEKLTNCSVIEGKLHILLIMEAKQEDYDKFSFPHLVEITGHLLLYRVYGLRTLRNLFPNLRVIRGQVLFYNYALVSFEMPDLEELGLISLNTIMRGAVRLEKNNKLCYIETIDWSRIATGVVPEDHYFRQNKDKKECVNQCPENCPMTEVDKLKGRRCWTSQHCQGNLECHCKGRFCQDGSNHLCCHEFCVGGCTGPGPSDCVACGKVIYNGQCDLRCVGDTYMFMSRRCLLENECINMGRGSETAKWKLIGREGNRSGLCVDECPHGYTVDEENEKAQCKKCKARCPRDCTGKVVDSIDSAQSFKGCTKILGPLEVQITGGSNIGVELEESLGQIEEVTHYIKIVRSYALVSLDFFKSLRVIHGERLEHSDYSLIIMDNMNLQELFPPAVSKQLKIRNGKVSFHFNRKLCFDKIKKFLDATGINDTDVDKTTNGDEIACSVRELNLTLKMISHDLAVLQWDPFLMADNRKLLGYVINYREVTSKNISIYQGRDACSENLWKTKDVEPDVETELLYNLKAWTMYAVYIQTYTLHTARQAAISNIVYFTTHPYHPSIPTNLKVEAHVEGELYVSWGPPKNPNGNITHYIVYWQRQVLDKNKFDVRDYCTNPIVSTPTSQETREREHWVNNQTGHSGACCACPKSKEQEKEEEIDRLIQIAFENHLQDSVYFKRPSMPEGMEQIASQNMRRRRSSGPAGPVLPPEEMERARRRYGSGPIAELSVNGSALANASGANSSKERAYNEARVFGTHIVLPNLGHYQEYNIEVLACQDTDKSTGKYYCGNQAMATARTLKSDSADNINSSSVIIETAKNETGERIILKWASPPAPNGLIVSFDVEYKKVEVNDMTPSVVCTRHLNYRQINGYILRSNLQPGNYSFRIRAISLAGNGSWTDYFYVNIPDTTVTTIDETVLVVVGVCVVIIISITVVIVWFVAKSRFSKDPDMTTISMNPHYMPSTDVYLPDEWEVDRDKIKLLRELGQGSFGMVYEGEAADLGGKGVHRVAVKTVNPSAGWHERMSFLKEASIMKAFKCHHVVKLLGVVSKGQPALVVMELMIWGDLKKFLRMHRPDNDESHKLDAITLKRLLRMAAEVSDGMAYLADKKFVHRDLAARNCMVGDKMTVKIGDFGMTRDIYETDYYRKGGKGLLPVRWMAPESLKDGIFTTMSDVWSFGVVLWEMATLATQPYQGLSNEEVLKFVIDGRVMEMPDKCPEKLFNFMKMCWQYRAEERPTFKELIEILVPDLDPDFQDVSYFFSEENHVDEPEAGRDSLGGNYPHLLALDLEGEGAFERGGMGAGHVLPPMAEEGGRYPGSSDNEEEEDVGLEDMDEARVHLMGPRRPEPQGDVELQPTLLGRHPHLGPGDMNLCECALLEEVPNGHKQSECSSPVSAIGPSDDSKGSSKSSSSSFSHLNGLSNGHIHLRVPRTTPC